MADYVFKVQVLLPGNVLETVILRQYVDPVDRCFDKFKSNLVQRYDVLTNTSFKMMWIDNDGDKISIFNEEDLRTFMELKGTKIYVEVDDASNPIEKKPIIEGRVPVISRGPIFRSCRRSGPERGWIVGEGRYRPQSAHEMNGNNINSVAGSNQPLALHPGVQCDGCDCEIRGYRYKCIECPDFDLCFSCEMKKIHGDHMMIRIVKPLDRPFNRHFLKAMMKQRCSFRESCEGKEKDKKARHRNDNAFVSFDDIMTDIAKNISTHCTTQPSTEPKNAEQNRDKSNPIDPKQFALNSETFAKAGEVLSNLAQHFVSVMDPFAVHEFIPPTQTNGNGTQSETKKADEPQKVADENQDKGLNVQPNVVPLATSTPPTILSFTPPATPVTANSPKELVTIEDVTELPSAPRDSSPIPDWAVVDAFGQIEGHIEPPQNTGAIPKTSAIQTPSSVGSVDAAQALPNYAILARDLEDHLHLTLKSQASQTPPPQMPIIHHPNPKVNEALLTMTSMGFSNGGGWLTRLLENVDGDIPKALEKLHPSQ